eukprot:PhM_4_TR11965/c0_g1_i1/m.30992
MRLDAARVVDADVRVRAATDDVARGHRSRRRQHMQCGDAAFVGEDAPTTPDRSREYVEGSRAVSVRGGNVRYVIGRDVAVDVPREEHRLVRIDSHGEDSIPTHIGRPEIKHVAAERKIPKPDNARALSSDHQALHPSQHHDALHDQTVHVVGDVAGPDSDHPLALTNAEGRLLQCPEGALEPLGGLLDAVRVVALLHEAETTTYVFGGLEVDRTALDRHERILALCRTGQHHHVFRHIRQSKVPKTVVAPQQQQTGLNVPHCIHRALRPKFDDADGFEVRRCRRRDRRWNVRLRLIHGVKEQLVAVGRDDVFDGLRLL